MKIIFNFVGLLFWCRRWNAEMLSWHEWVSRVQPAASNSEIAFDNNEYYRMWLSRNVIADPIVDAFEHPKAACWPKERLEERPKTDYMWQNTCIFAHTESQFHVIAWTWPNRGDRLPALICSRRQDEHWTGTPMVRDQFNEYVSVWFGEQLAVCRTHIAQTATAPAASGW